MCTFSHAELVGLGPILFQSLESTFCMFFLCFRIALTDFEFATEITQLK